MFKQPLVWGLGVFLVAGLSWLLLMAVNVLTNGALADIAEKVGYIALGSMPVAGFLELVRWVFRGDMEEKGEDRVLT